MRVAHHLIVVGFDAIVANKYIPCIRNAVQSGHIDSYSIIDLESQRSAIEQRVHAVDLKPRGIVYLPDSEARVQETPQEVIAAAVRHLCVPGVPAKVYIATEVRAHEAYLRFCVENHINSLVEKPVLAPMVDGRFKPSYITKTMEELIGVANDSPVKHSVMTLSRYHQIYNQKVIAALRERTERWEAPVTSFHLRAAGGVWNLQREFESRDDHPYKYGYGMMMHGAYHYVDLATQILSLNSALFSDRQLKLELSGFGAFPIDQHQRMSRPMASRFKDRDPAWAEDADDGFRFGETDVTSTFRLVDITSGRTVSLGTLSFEQTTPSIRNWGELPTELYNVNGRTSSVNMEAQLSTLYSMHVHCYDIPRGVSADGIDAFARLTMRANAALLPDEDYVAEESFDGLFHSDSNRRLMEHWLNGTEERSSLAGHLLPMKVTEALASSVLAPGRLFEVAF
ncbi:hypothetical protein [Streptomyces europaeiscabiei]|uniref:hypothetical protein n=1 Tax=Streptomyces europaeiscabiei TaxID=146819 RepID=UPI002E0F5A8E|nr:hypothetical protein OHB30_30400 [Streptomyces europaeiscabiei]